MRKILFTFFTVLFTFSFISFQNVSSQTRKTDDQKKTVAETTPPETVEIEEDDQISSKWLRNDMRLSDVVAYVNVTEVVNTGQTSDSVNCESYQGGGYCFYEMKAEVKEIFKGKIDSKPFVFHASADAGFPKNNFMGEQIVFLLYGEEDENQKRHLNTLENSRRSIEKNILEKMRNILNPQAVINENDPKEPYSIRYIRTNFEEAELVIYADVKSFKEDKEAFMDKFVLSANVKEVFKGKLKAGESFQYRDDLLYRPMREEDLGEQILYLEKIVEDGKTYYAKVDYTEGWIRHNILDKMRRVAKEKSNEKQ